LNPSMEISVPMPEHEDKKLIFLDNNPLFTVCILLFINGYEKLYLTIYEFSSMSVKCSFYVLNIVLAKKLDKVEINVLLHSEHVHKMRLFTISVFVSNPI